MPVSRHTGAAWHYSSRWQPTLPGHRIQCIAVNTGVPTLQVQGLSACRSADPYSLLPASFRNPLGGQKGRHGVKNNILLWRKFLDVFLQ